MKGETVRFDFRLHLPAMAPGPLPTVTTENSTEYTYLAMAASTTLDQLGCRFYHRRIR
jgi:hypothetical protein